VAPNVLHERPPLVSITASAGVLIVGRRPEAPRNVPRDSTRTHIRREDSADVLKANNVWTRSAFNTNAPGLDWSAFFDAAGLQQQSTFVVWHPAAFVGESALAASEPIETWREYLAYVTINRWSELLPKAFADERFDFFGRTLAGTPQIPDRWKGAVASTNAALGDAVGRLYVTRYFPETAKKAAQTMAADQDGLRTAHRPARLDVC
jgi:putative endopeptidase